MRIRWIRSGLLRDSAVHEAWRDFDFDISICPGLQLQTHLVGPLVRVGLLGSAQNQSLVRPLPGMDDLWNRGGSEFVLETLLFGP